MVSLHMWIYVNIWSNIFCLLAFQASFGWGRTTRFRKRHVAPRRETEPSPTGRFVRLPSGYVKIAIEYVRWNSEFSHLKWCLFHSYIKLPDGNYHMTICSGQCSWFSWASTWPLAWKKRGIAMFLSADSHVYCYIPSFPDGSSMYEYDTLW